MVSGLLGLELSRSKKHGPIHAGEEPVHRLGWTAKLLSPWPRPLLILAPSHQPMNSEGGPYADTNIAHL